MLLGHGYPHISLRHYFQLFGEYTQMWNCWVISQFYFSFFEGPPQCFPTAAVPFCTPTNGAQDSNFSTFLPTHSICCYLFCCCCYFLLFVICLPPFLPGGRKNYIVVLICVSLTVNDAEHLLMCLLAIHTSSLEKCLFKSFALWNQVVWFFLVSFRSSL